MGYKNVKGFGLPRMTEPREVGNELVRSLGGRRFFSGSATPRF